MDTEWIFVSTYCSPLSVSEDRLLKHLKDMYYELSGSNSVVNFQLLLKHVSNFLGFKEKKKLEIDLLKIDAFKKKKEVW